MCSRLTRTADEGLVAGGAERRRRPLHFLRFLLEAEKLRNFFWKVELFVNRISPHGDLDQKPIEFASGFATEQNPDQPPRRLAVILLATMRGIINEHA